MPHALRNLQIPERPEHFTVRSWDSWKKRIYASDYLPANFGLTGNFGELRMSSNVCQPILTWMYTSRQRFWHQDLIEYLAAVAEHACAGHCSQDWNDVMWHHRNWYDPIKRREAPSDSFPLCQLLFFSISHSTSEKEPMHPSMDQMATQCPACEGVPGVCLVCGEAGHQLGM